MAFFPPIMQPWSHNWFKDIAKINSRMRNVRVQIKYSRRISEYLVGYRLEVLNCADFISLAQTLKSDIPGFQSQL